MKQSCVVTCLAVRKHQRSMHMSLWKRSPVTLVLYLEEFTRNTLIEKNYLGSPLLLSLEL